MSQCSVFRAIADPTRRMMLDAMMDLEKSVSQLCELTHISQPAVSQHLKVLRDANLVTDRKGGRFRLYRVNPDALSEVDDWIAKYRVFWSSRLSKLEANLQASKKRVPNPSPATGDGEKP